MLICLLWTIKHNPKVADPLFSLLAAQRQSFLTIKPFDAFMVNLVAFPLKQNMETRRAEFTPLLCQLSKPDA